jgi:unsaturated chondroitin disaccharide hydrolase
MPVIRNEKHRAALDLAARQLKHLVETYPDYFPIYTVKGRWKHSGEAWTNWCEGFLGGQLWLLYLHTLQQQSLLNTVVINNKMF